MKTLTANSRIVIILSPKDKYCFIFILAQIISHTQDCQTKIWFEIAQVSALQGASISRSTTLEGKVHTFSELLTAPPSAANEEDRYMNWPSHDVRPHLLELENFLWEHNVDIDCITETFLSPPKKIFVLGFSTYRHNQATDRDSGAAILVSPIVNQAQSPISTTDANTVGVDIEASKAPLQRLPPGDSLETNPQPVLSEYKRDNAFPPKSKIPNIVASDLSVKRL